MRGRSRPLERGFFDLQVAIAGTVIGKQRRLKLWANLPIGTQRVDIGDGDAALQMRLDVLLILGLLAVDVARQVKVIVVPSDFLVRHHARETGNGDLLGERIDDLVNILAAQAVLGAVLHETLGRVDHENTLTGSSVFLVDNDNAGRNTGAIEQVRRQADDPLDLPLADQFPPDARLGIAPKLNADRAAARRVPAS